MMIAAIMLGSNASVTRYKLSGTVSVEGVAAVKRVVAIDRVTFAYIKSALSAQDGAWVINGLPESLAQSDLIAMAVDDSGVYNIEAADRVRPVQA